MKDVRLVHRVTTLNELSSDHLPVLLQLGDVSDVRVPVERSTVSWPAFTDHMHHNMGQIRPIHNAQELDEAVERLTVAIEDSLRYATNTIPVKDRRWALPARIRELMREGDRVRRTYQRNWDPDLKRRYNRLRDEVRRELAEFRYASFDAKLDALNTEADHSCWKMVKVLKGNTSRMPPIHGETGMAFTLEEKAEAHADTFERQCSPLCDDDEDEDFIDRVERVVSRRLAVEDDRHIEHASPTEVKEAIARCKSNKASGPDGIGNAALKALPLKAVVSLTGIINATLRLRHFPTKWKSADVVVLPKPSANPTFPQNYRPISLLSCLGKVCERVVQTRLQISVQDLNLIQDEQFGFRPKHSTVHQVLRLVEHITDGFNRNQSTCAVFFDVAKAFDKVWHEGLLFKMLEAGVPLALVQLIASYLDGRKARIKLKGPMKRVREEIPGTSRGPSCSPFTALWLVGDRPIPSAPFLALRTLLELANKYENYYPRAAAVLRNHVYVDDIVAGAQSINEALKVQHELIDLLGRGSFELRKWASNCKEILCSVSNTDLSMPISLDYDDTHCVKVLGLQWNPTSDQLQYSFSSRLAPCTKRSILSEIARIYDPLGFLTPCTLKAKIYMQQLWQLKISWDETPPLHVTENWKTFKNNLPVLSEWSLPRLMIPIKTQSVQLHLFCDASQQGYCTVAYLRSKTDTSITTSFICAKARVAPLKTISIPRLELCGAVLLADMLQNIKETLSPLIDFKSITAWSDSQVTLAWIASTPSRWKVFVANRVSHINNILPSTSWRYIPSSSNPADCGSRGMFPDQLIATELWWKGPSWLNKSPEYWPSINKIPETEDIIREQQQKFVQTTEIKTNIIDIVLNKFSSLSKIQRILAYIQRFLNLCQRQKGCSGINLSLFEVQQALTTMLRHVQNQHFSSLFISIKNNQLPPKPLRKLAPFIDREGLIRVGGRLKYAVIPFDHKHPVLLPKTNRVSELLVEELHKKHLHVGQKTLQSLVMRQYWILGSRSLVHRVVSRCIRCVKCKPRSYAPLMADLPAFRVAEAKAFSRVAVDFAGPLYTTISRCRGAKCIKSYISVFVCTSTKAIHLELVSDLSTEAFIAALRRFTSRRGQCTLILSDQGTNFVGTYNRLQEMAKISGQRLEHTWQFHPPGAPHFNGLAEAGVKSVKSHLIRVIEDQKLTLEEIYTVLTQIEAILNSRPLSAITKDPNDLQPLTPAHFLLLEPQNTSVLDLDCTQLPLNRLDRWKLLQRMVQDFWKRWHVEYLHSLQQRRKWNTPDSSPSVGDLVAIKNELRPPLQWEMGRIETLHPGVDGVIRVATVKTTHGHVIRPLVKICPLPT
ncbi:uncharacterized protein [Onthophagus taurus]|uniref:uncharacterized protein n=1 Tax=Onthophagus taurus TaxID=166361 RepID=UPI0039BE8CAF